MIGPGLDEAPADLAEVLVVAVMLLDVPDPVPSTPSPTGGRDWIVGEHRIFDVDQEGDERVRHLRDVWRRLTLCEMARARGVGPEVTERALEVLPYESIIFRCGWERWAELRRRARAETEGIEGDPF